MATTPTHNIYYPVVTDGITPLENVFSTLASSVESALNNVQPSSGTALPTTNLKAGRVFWHTTEQVLYVYTGTAWQAITRGAVTAWTVIGSASGSKPRAMYRKDDGIVEIIGTLAKGASSYSTGVTLPAGFRPGAETRWVNMADSAHQIVVGADGVITQTNYNATDVTFNVRFKAV